MCCFSLSVQLFPSVVRDANPNSKDSKEFDSKRRASMMRKCVTMKGQEARGDCSFVIVFPSISGDGLAKSRCRQSVWQTKPALFQLLLFCSIDFPRNMCRLLTNIPFMTKLISQLLEALVISGLEPNVFIWPPLSWCHQVRTGLSFRNNFLSVSGYLSFLQKFIKEQVRPVI